MKLAIMQPYLFPYIGYFQLINAVDEFVIHDDVQYIKNGWINRNYILQHNVKKYLTLPVANDHYCLLINQRYFVNDSNNNRAFILKILKQNYMKAPYFKQIFELVNNTCNFDSNNVANYISHTIKELCKYLNIPTKITKASALKNIKSLKGEEKVIDICKLIKATHYINPSGGVELYDKNTFCNNDISLSFLKPRSIIYKQWNGVFFDNLSIIDVLMFNSVPEVKKYLSEYDLI